MLNNVKLFVCYKYILYFWMVENRFLLYVYEKAEK
jgi:hypothetical protein